ncbi:hypothetical protein LTR56_011585 [Elasticomyces elasticus]|nr:hypothetical protein LTR56_011585 [Elasticomyces elasticus]KAK3656986.1 hypothetical protein LTR22_009487 [Elasticomyces elasticus]KAK4916209.1 hypothetical protein LTR49_015714 [Elasticomyces elasticus]KAK5764254.1 hypothetical protein LTS12_005705 [Elasticomyces elasticus]
MASREVEYAQEQTERAVASKTLTNRSRGTITGHWTIAKLKRPTKSTMPDKKQEQQGPSEEERKAESSKAAQQSIDAQKKAKELTQAAAGAGDPEERQKLLNEALEQEIASESFGKTAKYLQTGTAQGAIAGTGIGVGTGAGLGTLTGTLVGGVTSTVVGGLGGVVGSGVGAINGPFIKVGEKAGEGIRSVTGDLPGWEATVEQKGKLEEMIGQVNETERPDEDELAGLAGGTSGRGKSEKKEKTQSKGDSEKKEGGEQAKSSWSSYLPSMSSSADPSAGSKSSKVEESGSGEEEKRGQNQPPSWTESAASYMPSWGSKDQSEQVEPDDSKAKPAAPEHGKGSSSKASNEKRQNASGRGDNGSKAEENGVGKGHADPKAVDALREKLG